MREQNRKAAECIKENNRVKLTGQKHLKMTESEYNNLLQEANDLILTKVKERRSNKRNEEILKKKLARKDFSFW